MVDYKKGDCMVYETLADEAQINFYKKLEKAIECFKIVSCLPYFEEGESIQFEKHFGKYRSKVYEIKMRIDSSVINKSNATDKIYYEEQIFNIIDSVDSLSMGWKIGL